MRALQWAGRHELACDALASFFAAPALPTKVFGLKFPNPLGAVTWPPQPGTPPPRLFRAVSQQVIINRMGFNNPGAEAMAQTLAVWRALGRWPNHPVGINLGKSKITPLEEAAQDYANSFRTLWPHLDFFVVNVSSPNTPNLRQLQDKGALDEILAALQEANQALSGVSNQLSAISNQLSVIR